MRISIDKLNQQDGVFASYEEESNSVDIDFHGTNVRPYKILREAAAEVGFSDIETDELTNYFYRICVMKAIRAAMSMED